MRLSHLPPLLVAATLLAGCGTAAYTHDITVLIDDPSGRLGSGPVQVSIFDRTMGSSLDEWAATTMGTTSEGAPYTTQLPTTRVRTILSSDLPGQVIAALAVPAYEKRGYFVVSIAPDPAAEKAIVAPFVPYDGPEGSAVSRDGEQVTPLAVRYTSVPGANGWTLTLTVDVPPKR